VKSILINQVTSGVKEKCQACVKQSCRKTYLCLSTGLIYASPKKNLHQDKSDVGRQTKTKNDKNKRV